MFKCKIQPEQFRAFIALDIISQFLRKTKTCYDVIKLHRLTE